MEIIHCRLLLVSLLVNGEIVWGLIIGKIANPLRRRWHVLINVTRWLLHLLSDRSWQHGLLIQLTLLLWWKHILIVIVNWIRPIGGHMVILYFNFIQVFIYLTKYKTLSRTESFTYGLKLCLTRVFPSGVANLFTSLRRSSSFFPYVLSQVFIKHF